MSAKTALNGNQGQRVAESDGREINREDLVVLISGIFHAAFRHELPAFQRETGIQIKSELSPSLGDSPKSIESRLARGGDADVLIMADRGLDELIETKCCQPIPGSSWPEHQQG